MSKFLKYGAYMCLKVVFTWQTVPTIMKCDIVPNHAGTKDMQLYLAFTWSLLSSQSICMYVCMFPATKWLI